MKDNQNGNIAMTDVRWHRGKVLIAVIILIMLVLAIPATIWMHSNVREMAERQNSRMVPVVMIPGSSASINRFDRMIKVLNRDPNNQHSVLKIKVDTNDHIEYHGKINRDDYQPIIVVGFQNNHDGYGNIKQQARWFNLAFHQLSEQYKFHRFNAFGHSNGGLIWTLWLEKYYRHYSGQIKIAKLMTVGTPYNFDERSLAHKTQMFNDLVKGHKRIPKDLMVYSVDGTETYDFDGIVPENSVWAGKYIYQKRVKSYTMLTVTGKNAEHSDLPQNKQVVRLIQEYLMDNDAAHNNSSATIQNKKPNARRPYHLNQ